MNICVIYGGKSGEHEISLLSASSIIRGIDNKNKVILIGITKEGKWYLQSEDEYKRICKDKKAVLTITKDEKNAVSIIPGAGVKSFSVAGSAPSIRDFAFSSAKI